MGIDNKQTTTYRGISDKVINLDQCTILDWAEGFMLDRRSRGLAKGTLDFYRKKLKKFVNYFTDHGIADIEGITPGMIRKYFVWLEDQGHNRGGVIAHYKAIRTFFKWYQIENELPSNPLDKVKISTMLSNPLEPANAEDIKKMLAISDKRDRSIILTLLDTGLRASELIAITLNNINLITGLIHIVKGKGGKSRTVYVGRKTRLSIRKYLQDRPEHDYLFTTQDGEPFTYWGLRQIIRRRSVDASVNTPSLHSFRRLFALTMLRNGVDIYSLQLLMGHADLQVLRRYLKQTNQDTLEAHLKGSPVDRMI